LSRSFTSRIKKEGGSIIIKCRFNNYYLNVGKFKIKKKFKCHFYNKNLTFPHRGNYYPVKVEGKTPCLLSRVLYIFIVTDNVLTADKRALSKDGMRVRFFIGTIACKKIPM